MSDYTGIEKPWLVWLSYSDDIGHLTIRIEHHTDAGIAFDDSAIKYCGGAVEFDESNRVTRCHDEPAMVDTAREIAGLSKLDIDSKNGYRSLAESRYPDAEWIAGNGRFALLTHCRSLAVSLHKTKSGAEKMKLDLNKFGCGGLCSNHHEVVDLRELEK